MKHTTLQAIVLITAMFAVDARAQVECDELNGLEICGLPPSLNANYFFCITYYAAMYQLCIAAGGIPEERIKQNTACNKGSTKCEEYLDQGINNAHKSISKAVQAAVESVEKRAQQEAQCAKETGKACTEVIH